jgi:DNA-binding NarL/FixJ family response regulator
VAPSILVVDDHPLYRAALEQVLRDAFTGFDLHVAASAAEGLQLAASKDNLRLILLDLGLPGLRGIEAVSAFRRQYPDAALVVVSSSEDRREVSAAFAEGARAFVSKATSPPVLVDVLQRIFDGRLVQPEWLAGAGESASWQAPASGLTPRQREILFSLCEGHTNKEIGLRLGLAEITVKMHVSAIFRVFGVANRTQAVLAARHLGYHAAQGTSSSDNS